MLQYVDGKTPTFRFVLTKLRLAPINECIGPLQVAFAGVTVEWGPPELGPPGPQFTGKMGPPLCISLNNYDVKLHEGT